PDRGTYRPDRCADGRRRAGADGRADEAPATPARADRRQPPPADRARPCARSDRDRACHRPLLCPRSHRRRLPPAAGRRAFRQDLPRILSVATQSSSWRLPVLSRRAFLQGSMTMSGLALAGMSIPGFTSALAPGRDIAPLSLFSVLYDNGFPPSAAFGAAA